LKSQVRASEERNRVLLGEQIKTTEEKAQRSEATTRMISYFATSLLEQDTEEDIVWDLAKNCVAKLGFEDCVVYLLNEEGTALVQKAAYGPKSPNGREIQNPLNIPMGIGIVGSVAQTGQPKLVADTRLDPLYIIDDKPRLSELAVPIISNGQTLGVIDSENSRPNFFRQQHLEAVSAIASLCANKIVRVRAEGQLQRLNQELEKRILERTAELSRTNEKLRSSEERFSKAFLSSPCLMSLTRMNDGRVIDMNEGFLRILNKTKEEAIGKTTLELGLWGNDEERGQFLDALRTDGVVRYRERRFLIDGQEHVFLHSADVIKLQDAPCLLTVAIDISDRKRAEAELLKALDRERELSQLKSNFVATVSHEFRTPLEIIMSSGEILDRYLDRLRPEQRHEHLQAIHDAVRRMSALMEEALVLGKVESGKLQIDKTPVDLVNFCARVIEEIRAATEDRCPIELMTQDLPPMPALADESLLRHILTNLLSNAVKYSKPGATVSLLIAQADGHAIFQVADTGCGIPLPDQERVFNAFHRGQNVRKIRGTGLGLVIAKRCVDLHNGRIRFQSAVGQGTTFQVRLPLYPSHNNNSPNNTNSTWFHKKTEVRSIGI
jgi:PAS domain S-box-containing protein